MAISSIMQGAQAAYSPGMPTALLGGAGIFTTAVNILLFVVGVLSVIMIIVGGLRYVVSGGNTSAVSAAKTTVLYAIVGVVIAFLAYALVNFVLSALVPGATGLGGGANWSNL
jgi:hypothetical protein